MPVTAITPEPGAPVSSLLLTLAEYKTIEGIQVTDTRDDPQITALLSAASRAVRTYTGRSFGMTTNVPGPREYQYDNSDILDIDDCTEVTSVTIRFGVQDYPLASDQWTVMPQDDSEVFYYLVIFGGPYFAASPQMGFLRNLDQYPTLVNQSAFAVVTGTWGWPAVPDDVKLATAMTVSELRASTSAASEGLAAEAIEGWSRSWAAGKTTGYTAMAVPNRARDLLSAYQRVFV